MCDILKSARDKYETCLRCCFNVLLVLLGLFSIIWVAVFSLLISDNMFTHNRTTSVGPLYKVVLV